MALPTANIRPKCWWNEEKDMTGGEREREIFFLNAYDNQTTGKVPDLMYLYADVPQENPIIMRLPSFKFVYIKYYP